MFNPYQLYNNIIQVYQHIVHIAPNNNHYKVSKITKFYSIIGPNKIPTSIDLNIQNAVKLPVALTNPLSTNPSVRNTSPKSPLKNIINSQKSTIKERKRDNTVDSTTSSDIPSIAIHNKKFHRYVLT